MPQRMKRRLLSTPIVTCRDGEVEGGSAWHRRTILVFERPFFHLRVVHGTYWMVVIDTAAASGIPVVRDREFGVGFAVGRPVVEVGVVSVAVQRIGAVPMMPSRPWRGCLRCWPGGKRKDRRPGGCAGRNI